MDGEKISIIFIILAALFIFMIGGCIIIYALKKEKKEKEEFFSKCTFSVQGVLVGTTQSHSFLNSNDGYDYYNYNPIVRYEFSGQTYEKEYGSTSSWENVKPGQPLTIFVNPNNAEEIYVPLPEDSKKNRNKKTKIFLAIFVVWCFIAVIGTILMEK